jgi:predicted dehydrogenase
MTVQHGILLGLGGIARQAHLPGFLQGEGVAERLRVVATVDEADRATGFAGIPHFADRHAAARSRAIDFVDVCTPTASHLELTLWALERGYHALCEKPVALCQREVAQLRAASRNRLVVMGCHQYRYNPAWQQLRAWLDAGAIGAWHLAEFQVYRTAADAGIARSSEPWRGRQAEAGGGVLLDHGTHFVYQLLDVAGMPASVQCWTGTLRHQEYDVEDTAHLLLDFGGRLGVLFLTWAADRRENRIRFTGSDGSIEWSGGMLRLLGKHGPLERNFSAELDKASYYHWFASLFHDFADRIERQDTIAPLEDIARVTHVLEAAYGAHANGCRVTI